MKRFVSVLPCALLFLLPELGSAAVRPLSDELRRTTIEQGATRTRELKIAKIEKAPQQIEVYNSCTPLRQIISGKSSSK